MRSLSDGLRFLEPELRLFVTGLRLLDLLRPVSRGFDELCLGDSLLASFSGWRTGDDERLLRRLFEDEPGDFLLSDDFFPSGDFFL